MTISTWPTTYYVCSTSSNPRPVLAGDSMAGGELSTLASQHPDRVSDLVYLDALGDTLTGSLHRFTQPGAHRVARPTPHHSA